MAREGSSEEEVFYLEPKDQKALSPLSCWYALSFKQGLTVSNMFLGHCATENPLISLVELSGPENKILRNPALMFSHQR